jgi:uncharacterized protein (TIGR02678 family)
MGNAWRKRRSAKMTNAAVLEERLRECVHALLNRPWIAKEQDPEMYYQIKERFEQLKDWFMEQAGLSLISTRTLVKLDKVPVIAHPWMGFAEFRDPMDYVFFTYGLWFLEGRTEMDQFTLQEMVEQIKEHMMSQEMTVNWTVYSHRQSMVRALKKLNSLGVLHVVDGDEDSWVRDAEAGNVLYECSPHARYVLRRFPQDLSSYQCMEELSDPIHYPDTPDGASLRRRHRVYRRFLMEPVVLDRQWSEEDKYYVTTQRSSLIEQMNHMLGFEGHRYREGLLFFHPELTGEAQLFPTPQAVSDLVLLVAGEIRRQLHAGEGAFSVEADGTICVTRNELESLLLQIREKHKDYWSKELREASSQVLAEKVISHLCDWSLGEWEDEQLFLIYPVLGRWEATYQISQFVE